MARLIIPAAHLRRALHLRTVREGLATRGENRIEEVSLAAPGLLILRGSRIEIRQEWGWFASPRTVVEEGPTWVQEGRIRDLTPEELIVTDD